MHELTVTWRLNQQDSLFPLEQAKSHEYIVTFISRAMFRTKWPYPPVCCAMMSCFVWDGVDLHVKCCIMALYVLGHKYITRSHVCFHRNMEELTNHWVSVIAGLDYWTAHVGYVHQCLHKCEPYGFSTFFNVPWRRMWLRVIRVWPLERTSSNRDGRAALGVQI